MNVPDGELRARFGTARRPRRPVEHDRQYDEQYWAVFRETEAYARRECDDGSRHVYEAELKASEQSRGAPAERS